MNEVCHVAVTDGYKVKGTSISEVEARLIRHVQVYGVATQETEVGFCWWHAHLTRKELQRGRR